MLWGCSMVYIGKNIANCCTPNFLPSCACSAACAVPALCACYAHTPPRLEAVVVASPKSPASPDITPMASQPQTLAVCLHHWRVPQFALKYACNLPPPRGQTVTWRPSPASEGETIAWGEISRGRCTVRCAQLCSNSAFAQSGVSIGHRKYIVMYQNPHFFSGCVDAMGVGHLGESSKKINKSSAKKFNTTPQLAGQARGRATKHSLGSMVAGIYVGWMTSWKRCLRAAKDMLCFFFSFWPLHVVFQVGSGLGVGSSMVTLIMGARCAERGGMERKRPTPGRRNGGAQGPAAYASPFPFPRHPS